MNDSTFFRYNSIVDIGVLKTGELVSIKKVSDKRFIILVGILDKLFLLNEGIYLNDLFPVICLKNTTLGLDVRVLSINEIPRKLTVDDFDKLFVTGVLVRNLIKDFDRIVADEESAFCSLCEIYRQMANERPFDRLVEYIESSF